MDPALKHVPDGATPGENTTPDDGRMPGIEIGDQGTVVIVDDDEGTLTILAAHARRFGYKVRAIKDPHAAVRAMEDMRPDVLVTDMVMPDITGADLTREGRRIDPDLEVLLITGFGDQKTASAVQELGASGYLSKPVDPDKFGHALREAVVRRNAKEYQRRTLNWMYRAMADAEAKMAELTLGALESLMQAMEERSPHFTGHSRAVALLAAAVAQELGLPEEEVETIRRAGLLHDIGMIGVPDAIVLKPGQLSTNEFEAVRRHPEVGARILAPMKHFATEAHYILDHHERWDGSGYPEGKRGDDISLGGQIVGVAEAWTGITTNRTYRSARSSAEGYEILMERRDEWFSGRLIEALVATDIGVIE